MATVWAVALFMGVRPDMVAATATVMAQVMAVAQVVAVALGTAVACMAIDTRYGHGNGNANNSGAGAGYGGAGWDAGRYQRPADLGQPGQFSTPGCLEHA